jgi:RNA polymerase sigma factor (sigma-70 family)
VDKAKQILVTNHRGVVVRILGKLNVVRGEPYKEAYAYGMLLLCEAAELYDPAKGEFLTWAWWRVEGRIKNWLRDETSHNNFKQLMKDSHESTDCHPCEVAAPDKMLEDKETATLVLSAVRLAPKRVKDITKSIMLKGLSPEDHATRSGVTRCTAYRDKWAARELLRPLRDSLVQDHAEPCASRRSGDAPDQ